MKFFSFLKEEIHPAPESKVIPKEDFTLLIEASEIVEKAHLDAKQINENALNEGEVLKQEAKKEGFSQGLEKLNEHILKLDQTIKTLENKYEKKVLPIAIKVARKIITQELKTHPEVIVDIIKTALKPVSQHFKVKIFVNKQDLDILEKEKDKINEILQLAQTFSLEERDDIEPGGCIIETEKGIINAQLENQFRALEKAFSSLEQKK